MTGHGDYNISLSTARVKWDMVPVTSYLRDSDEFCINPLKVSLDVREGCCKSSVRFPRTTGAGSAEGLKFPWTTDKDGIEDMHRLRPLSRDGELTADA